MARDKSIILLFGPQALSLQESSLHSLKTDVRDTTANRWILDTVAELPAYMKALHEKFPKLQVIPAVKLLEDLHGWLDADKAAPASSNLPNVMLSPLVVLSQLTQYSKYLDITHEDGQNLYASHGQQKETVGFCIGLLSALAVSSASNQAQFQQYGAAAVRLAALIGALVDAQDVLGEHGESTSFATICTSNQAKTEMIRIMKQFPGVSYTR